MEEYDVYFDGTEKGIDCPCCGDRWHEKDDYDAENMPKVFGKYKKWYNLIDENGNWLKSIPVNKKSFLNFSYPMACRTKDGNEVIYDYDKKTSVIYRKDVDNSGM